MKKHSLGIDIGASTIKAVLLSEDNHIIWRYYQFHKGNIEEGYQKFLLQLEKEAGKEITYVMVSGSGATALALEESYKANSMVAMREGVEELFPEASSIINIGGQSAIYISGIQCGSQIKFQMNHNCAAGTGAFFEDQMHRLGKKVEDYSEVIKGAKSVPRIAGRCSVFAKTDIIHRQQEGVPVEDILLGLAYAVITNFKNTIVKNQDIEKPVAFIGGVSRNEGTKQAIQEIFHLNPQEFLCSEDAIYAQAVGTAICARKEKKYFLYQDVKLEKRAEKLELAPLKKGTDIGRIHPVKELLKGEKEEVFLGIDVGSTSTNLVLLNRKCEVIDIQYIRTGGDSRKAVQTGLNSIRDRLGEHICICSTGVTGSGRYLIGNLLGAERIQDEITAQAKGASFFCPEVDTIFEIGGQDSKFIRLEKGRVVDFQMNKICAAGTGSFVEEQAERLEIPIQDYGKLSLSSRHPVDLGERCTVFIETNINTALANKVKKEDIVAGLCYSIIKNYLHKVVGNKKIGEHICLQGGVAYNEGIVAAFQSVFGEKVQVTPYFSVTGAVGAAILAMENENGREFSYQLADKVVHRREGKNSEVQLHLEQYQKSYQWFLSGYREKGREELEQARKEGRPIVGVPRALMIYRLFPMAYHFFKNLGCEVVLSRETDENIIQLGQQYTKEETCYPIKLLHGHMVDLVKQGVDYIFMPSVLMIKHQHTNIRHNYGCVYMQSAPQLVAKAIGLDKTRIQLLNPVLNLDMGKPEMVKAMVKIGMSLGKNASVCAKAMAKGGMALAKYSEDAEKMGREILSKVQPEEKIFVLITRNYGISDPVLSMGIAEILIKMGYQVITLAHLPGHSIDLSGEYPNLYWPFAQHILSGAKIIKENPNLYAVYLTNHGCGPDGMISHLFAEIMGEKPYLALEVDEHYSKVGVITKLEAFVSSLKDSDEERGIIQERGKPRSMVISVEEVSKEERLYLSSLYPYSEIAAAGLKRLGYEVRLLPQVDKDILNRGRSYTRMKEYESFTAKIGSVMELEEREKGQHQVLVWQTQGAEADGFYAMLIQSFLESSGNQKARIIAPMLERVYKDSFWAEFMVKTLVLGDLILMLEPIERAEILGQMIAAWNQKELSWAEVEEYAQVVGGKRKCREGQKLQIIGDPYCIFQKELNNGVLEKLETQGYWLEWMSFSEYLISMWEDEWCRCGEKGAEQLIQHICRIQDLVETENYQNLRIRKDEELAHLTGGNARYRMAKQKQHICGIAGKIVVSSAYENISTILNLVVPEDTVPCLSMEFDGNPNEDDELRVAAFLKIVENNCSLG